ncbi:hypothetical protein IAE30_18085 [Pantoea sp. S61]|nr:hypothetical protein [Pantoea sp. S61]MBK0125653.1 hypothetical protein [Pantoea sp. S61]
MLIRLQQALADWQPAQSFDIQPGTAGVASPHRLATEWAGFRLQSAGQGYYAKVLFDDQKTLIDFQRSAEISRQAGELGIAPALCHADPQTGVLIFAALDDGFRWARLDALRDPHHFTSLTRTLDKLHHSGLPLPSHSRQQDMLQLRLQVETHGVQLPEELQWIGECVDLA